MRLYLSSDNVGKHGDVLQKMAGDNRKVAYIGNAKDYWGAESRAKKTADHRAEFEEKGFEFTEFDLRNYFDQAKLSKEEMSKFGLIWCSGGNSFMLRRALRDSGLDKIIVDLVSEDKVVYGGSSAGAIVATPTLHGTELADDPNVVGDFYNQEVLWEGLNLVSYHIVPHVNSYWFGPESASMIQYLKKNQIEYKALEDGHVIVVDGDKQELLT